MGIKEVNRQYIKFDTWVQVLKYEVLKRVSEKTFQGTIHEEKWNVSKEIIDDLKPNIRCCIYKERAIVEERVRLALGGNKKNNNIIEVIDIACDECPVNRFVVNDACRGCLAKKCKESCNFGAIYFDNKRCHIDYSKCKECGKCKNACPYEAISEVKRPCMRVCHPKALSFNIDSKKAVINNDNCIQCGACVINCPFGAILDKSFIVDVINLLKIDREVYAVIAPAISSQFKHSSIANLISAIKKLGFKDVFEAALGADLVAEHETKEFLEKNNNKLMTSSCCPAFVSFVEKKVPELKNNISKTVSPMIAMARVIKNNNLKAKVIFIGPCIAKKMEIFRGDVVGEVEYVITFEELLAMLDSKDISIDECEEGVTDNGSFYGRLFARVGGVTESIEHLLKEKKIDIDFKAMQGDGIADCDIKLKMAKLKRLNCNFLEGMACKGGCINGPGSLNHDTKNSKAVDKYSELSKEKNILTNIKKVKINNLNLSRNIKKE
ncbi:4Fe-4S dicluster domain-containing protein [Clostridium tarantellae]|uniref:Ferredoxin n=1 Tax=Clostridium tarantellae TaxID=39493 RepID=A0A6I1MNN1_9CLOT|nr:4Fe-4S dicluster domain-containing protein [Clostridium tarantellae]MPQ43872.1 ferredoxin [Clostridium tarantellae]